MRTSWCTRCEEWKPVGDFSPKTRHPDGSYATVLSRCKPCLAELSRIRRREDPEWARATYRRDWQRIRTDPEKLARRRRLTRENSVAYRRRHTIELPLSVEDLRAEAQRELWRLERAVNRAKEAA